MQSFIMQQIFKKYHICNQFSVLFYQDCFHWRGIKVIVKPQGHIHLSYNQHTSTVLMFCAPCITWQPCWRVGAEPWSKASPDPRGAPAGGRARGWAGALSPAGLVLPAAPAHTRLREIARWHGQPDEAHKSFWHCISAISWTVKEAPVIKIHSETQLEDCSFSKANVMHSFCLGSFSSLSHSLWTRVIKQAWCSPIIFTLKAINQDWLRKWRQLSKISYVTRVRLK